MPNILDFMLTLGDKIYDTFSNIVEWMQTNGREIPSNGLFNDWEWVSVFDMITTYGLTVLMGAIVIKWVVDMFRP